MHHPFNLNLADLEAIDLDFEEEISTESEKVDGGLSIAVTEALWEGGDCYFRPLPDPIPVCPPREKPPIAKCPPYKPPISICPPVATTMALGEEGGCLIPIDYL
ncbi:MAG: hypothetical protein VKL59_10105 [Nostocaceae cyanobacterium]|nr:hypothetical protein [Nostocaceae cyanobacterium]